MGRRKQDGDVLLNWDQFKETIYTLYIVERRRLQGTNGVIDLMRERHGFVATKSQYELRFRNWGLRFRKNREGSKWKIISQKIEKRRRDGRDTMVRHNGAVVPSHEVKDAVARHGYITVLERFAEGPSTPDGFTLLTPISGQEYLVAMDHLPILQWQWKAKDPPLIDGPKLQSIIRKMSAISESELVEMTESLFPPSIWQQSEHHDKGRQMSMLMMLLYFVSNNFPVTASSISKITLFGKHNYGSAEDLFVEFTNMISHVPGPIHDAIAEKILKFFIPLVHETSNYAYTPYRHLGLVRRLLKLGFELSHIRYKVVCIDDYDVTLIPVTPLEVACLQGDMSLAYALLESAGQYCCNDRSLVFFMLHRAINLRVDRIDKSGPVLAISYGIYVDPALNRADKGFIYTLLDHGADINAACRLYRDQVGSVKHGLEGVSPIMVAAMARDPALVTYFIEKGANIHHRAHCGASVLHMCICSPDEMIAWEERDESSDSEDELDDLDLDDSRDLDHRPSGTKTANSRVLEVFSILSNAGASSVLKMTAPWGTPEKLVEFSMIDLAVFRGCTPLLRELLAAGASLTKFAMEIALQRYAILSAEGVHMSELLTELLENEAPILVEALAHAPMISTKNPQHTLKCQPLVWLKSLEYATSLNIKTSNDINNSILTYSLVRQPSFNRQTLLLRSIAIADARLFKHMIRHQATLEAGTELTVALESCIRTRDIHFLESLLDTDFPYRGAVLQCCGKSLLYAVKNDMATVVELLLLRGTDPNVRAENDYQTPLSMAIWEKKRDIYRSLLKAGATVN